STFQQRDPKGRAKRAAEAAGQRTPLRRLLQRVGRRAAINGCVIAETLPRSARTLAFCVSSRSHRRRSCAALGWFFKTPTCCRLVEIHEELHVSPLARCH